MSFVVDPHYVGFELENKRLHYDRPIFCAYLMMTSMSPHTIFIVQFVEVYLNVSHSETQL